MIIRNIRMEMVMKILFTSLGCDKNLVDSEIMLGQLSEKGYSFLSVLYGLNINRMLKLMLKVEKACLIFSTAIV